MSAQKRYIHILINMNIQNLVDLIRIIALDDLELSSFYVGNTWDHSAGKGDQYPCLWLEMPILVDYQAQTKLSKQYTFSVDILMLPKMDNLEDEISKISECEILADKFLSYLKLQTDFSLVNLPSGLSVKSFNADNAVGIRLDLKVNTPRECL